MYFDKESFLAARAAEMPTGSPTPTPPSPFIAVSPGGDLREMGGMAPFDLTERGLERDDGNEALVVSAHSIDLGDVKVISLILIV